ncbi:amidase [Microbacteriaceae bacterium SG_E_30_P1]|uniref:Amidase n=1 Tax=Antiquaquibacter oligotrophicus TaxID=2880260 RepID=A0ABT6KMG9_9MICO|nr:amidase [Antiquaquibacter oligotrophicus]MDH6181206.1 amidase [Antiquaquibacter oligotrophicus]UDF13099.1 amidase [Antiquaquibacter oligotrophicus]
MTELSHRSRFRRRHIGALAAGATSLALLASFVATPATAVTTVPTSNAAWQIHDSARPGLDTGSIRAINDSRVDGYGNIFVKVVDSTSPPLMNGQMMRGFGLTFDGVGTFSSTNSVPMGEVAVTRRIDLGAASEAARFFDTFTNTSTSPVTVEVSFGGALGYGSGAQQGTVAATTNGDTAIGGEDSWVVVAQPGTNTRPIGTVLGTPAPFDGAIVRTGNQERNPFETPLVTVGHEANFYGFINSISLAPGETQSLLRYVHAGSTGAGAVADASADLAAIASAPDLTGLGAAEVCTIANWDLPEDGCADAPAVELPPLPAPQPTTTTIKYDVVGKSIAQLQADMELGVVTSEEITQAYLDRIAAYDGGPFGFNTFITVAPDALDQARAADAKRAAGETGELLGIPMGIKDIYDTYDMPTTGGSAALEGWTPAEDSYQVAKLREAGAVILGKTNLSEWANSGSRSESGYGQTWNALAPSKTSFGSSGGSAVALAASLAAGTMGTQTGVSLYAPATGSSMTMFRGTDGMASTRGVMPLTYGQDYAGPIARTVTDLAFILNATTGTDPGELLTAQADAHRPEDWTEFLEVDALEGKRVGFIPSSFVSGFADDDTGSAMLASLSELESAGATLVEMGNPPSAGSAPSVNGWALYISQQQSFPFPNSSTLKADERVLPYNRGTDNTGGAVVPPPTDQQIQARIDARQQSKDRIAQWMDAADVDFVVYAGFLSDIYNNDGNSNQHSSDRATGVPTSNYGVPTVVVPMGANGHGYPMALQIVGRAWDDAAVLGAGYALEQRVQGQLTSQFAPPLTVIGDDGEVIPPAAEQPALAHTGSESQPIAIVSLALLGAGLLLAVGATARRRQRS